MPYATDQQYSQVIDLPVSLPLTQINPGGWIIVASYNLIKPQTLTLKWLQLTVTNMASEAQILNLPTASSSIPAVCLPYFQSGNEITTVNSTTPTGSVAYAVLIKLDSIDTAPITQTLFDSLIVPANYQDAPDAVAPMSNSRDSNNPVILTEPALYALLVANNTTNKYIAVTANGALTVDLN